MRTFRRAFRWRIARHLIAGAVGKTALLGRLLARNEKDPHAGPKAIGARAVYGWSGIRVIALARKLARS